MMTKRLFDIFLAIILLLLFTPILIISYILATIDTGSNGIFFQKRVGQYGKLFTIYKLKTIHPQTRSISTIGRFFRKYKIDELPQLFNVLAGCMSFVGPRPDVVGYYDKLQGDDRNVLLLKPGITSAAAIKYRNEEAILSAQKDPLLYNDEIIFPDKVKMNLEYYKQRSFLLDIKILAKTLLGFS